MSTRKGKQVSKALKAGGFERSRVHIVLRPGEMVRLLREKNELTQAELAKRTGFTQATISSIENERVQLGVERAKVLARALHVHPGVLLFHGWNVDERSSA